MITSLILASAISGLSWQSTITQTIKENPKLVGRVVEVCVDSECVKIDRTNDIVLRDTKGGGEGPAQVEQPQPSSGSSGGGLSDVITGVLEKVGGAHGSVKIEFEETTKGPDGSEHTVKVKVDVSGGTGGGK